MKASDYIAAYLHAQGVTHVFEVVGGMIAHLIDSIHRQGKIRLVSVHHEQSASFAADAMGRLTGVPGVAMATSGPGATNLLTGIGSCYFDSSPAVFITGQVNRNEQRGNRAIRQLGFQETDIVPMAKPICKLALAVDAPDQVPLALKQAFTVALSGRPGPVLLDIPMDVQRLDVAAEPPGRLTLPETSDVDPGAVQELIDQLRTAKRPLILAGGGIRSAGATELFRRLTRHLRIPVVNSLMATDVLPFSHALRVGMIGSYGNRWANQAIGRSDLLLVLGSRLDIRQTGAQTESFRQGRTIFHVDCEAGEMNNRITDCRAIVANLRSLLALVLQRAEAYQFPDRSSWISDIAASKRAQPDTAELRDLAGVNPNQFIHQLSAHSASASAFVADVGQHQMWAAQSIELHEDQRFVNSGGMGAMGFALPAAIGAAVCRRNQPVVLIAGDGGFQLSIQELQTVVRNRLPIKMVILDNKCLGMIRQFQQSYFAERYQSSYWGYTAPDFTAVARAYGIEAGAVRGPADIEQGLDQLWRDPTAPFLLQVMIDPSANVYPKLAFGRPITEMEPFAKPMEMEGT
jgi:acetolactate synthase-1/2/3 large subunit